MTNPTPLLIPPTSPDKLIVLESVEGAHSSHPFNKRVASILGTTRPSIRMDSQAKYCALARGDGGLYLRMPVNNFYEEKIWVSLSARVGVFDKRCFFQDHAAADLLVREAGGIVSDSRGVKLNFGLGRVLGKNYGIIATGKEVHSVVIEAIQRALTERSL
jgi:3'(2'), 5'-bisphosphate nucleotidase